MTHVLIVDDELSIRETFQMILEEAGYDVATAADFFEAEPLLTEQSFDVVIADIILPRVNGLALLQRVREIDEDVPVIMVTGDPDISTAAEAVRHGAYDYVAKPVTLEKLLSIVGRASEKKRLLDEKRCLEAENRAYQTDLEKRVVERTAELEQRNRELTALIETGNDVSATLNLAQVLKRVTQRTAQICNAHRCTILLLTEESQTAIPIMSQFGDGHVEQEMWQAFKDTSYPIPVSQVPEAQYVIREQQPLFVSDAPASSLPKSLIEPFGIKSVLLVPLVSKERTIGLMALDRIEEDEGFTAGQTDLAMAVAAQAATAVENARLFEAERAQLLLTQTLQEVGSLLTTSLSLDQVCQRILDLLSRVVEYDSASIQLLDADGKLSLLIERGFPDPQASRQLARELSDQVLERFTAQKVIVIPDTHNDDRLIIAPGVEYVRSWIGAPLLVKGKLVGLVNVDSATVNAYGAATGETVMAFANQAAIAIENARLFDEERNSRRLADTLREVTQALNSTLSLDQVLGLILTELEQVIPLDSGSIMLLEDGDLIIRAVKGFANPESVLEARLNLDTALLNREIVESKHPLVIGSVHEDERWLKAAQISNLEFELRDARSWMGVPLTVKEHVIGILTTDKHEANFYRERDSQVALAFANQAAIAIENARLFEATRRRAAELETIHQANLHLTANLELQPLLEAILEHVLQLISADDAHVFLYDGERLTFGAAMWAGDHQQKPYAEPRLHGLTYTVARSGERVIVPDVKNNPLFQNGQWDNWDGAIVGMPLRIADQVQGVMNVAFEAPHPFSADELLALELLADQAAIAIRNARLFGVEQQRRQETETLYRAAQALAATATDLHQVFERILSELEQVVPYDSASVQLLQDGRLQIIGGRGFPNPDEIVGLEFDASSEDNPNNKVVRQKESVIVADAPQIYSEFRHEPHAAAGIRSWMGVPLLFSERLIGMLTLDKREPGFYTPEHARLTEAFAAQAAIAIENAQLFEAEQRRTAELTRLHEAAVTVSSSLEPSGVLRALAEQAGRALDTSSVYICDWDEESAQSTVLAEWVSPDAPDRASDLGAVYDLRRYPATLQALREKRPLAVQATDPALDLADRESAGRYGWKAHLIVPLVMRNQVIGYAELWESRREREFTETEIRLCQTLAADAAVAIENARLYDAAQREIAERKRAEKVLQERAIRLELIERVGQRTTAILGLDELLEQAANLISDTFEYYNVNVFLVEGDAIALRASTFPSYRPSDRLVRLRVGEEGITGWVAANCEPLLVPDVSVDPRYHVTLEGIETRSELAVPIKLKGTIIGVLDAQSTNVDAFSQADLFTLQTVAGQLAIAIENARLYEETRRHVKELTALHTIDLTIASTLNLDQVLQRVYEQVSTAMDVATFYIALYDEEKGELYPPIIVDQGKQWPPQTLNVKDESGLSGWVVRTREPLWVGDMEKEQDTLPVEAIALGGLTRSLMVLPLVARDKVVGVISAQSYEPYAFDEGHRRLFSDIAGQVAIAIENARLFKETNRRLDELSFLHDVALTTAVTLDFDEILRRAVESVNSRLQLDVFGFLLVDEDAGVVRLHPTFLGVPDEIADFSIPLGEGITGWVAQTGQPLLAPDVSKEPRYHKAISAIRSEVCVPLKIGGKIIGVIDAESTQLNAFSEDDVRLFSTLASQLGVVLDNARLFKETNRRLDEARLIQEVVLAAASTLNFDLVLERAVRALNRAMGVYRLSFLLPDEQQGVLVSHPSLTGFAKTAFQVSIKNSLAGRAYRTGLPMLVQDTAEESASRGIVPDTRSALAAPVRVGTRIVAVLYAESPQPGTFGADEMRFFTTIAGQLGVALENARLYQRLEGQTAELTRAYGELQEMDRLRAELVQNVGHELRTPLSIIKGYVELLLNGDLGPIPQDQQAALKIINRRTATLTRLINNLTVLQALSKKELSLVPTSLVEIMQRVLTEFREPAQKAGIALREELPQELPPVMGDEEQLELAFGHLLDNAIKFSPGGGAVTIRAWTDADTANLSITDEGIGIAPEHLDRVFERFYQVDGSASRRFGGMGVGLALVWEIVQAHGGTVQVESNVGKGSKFIVVLPLAAPRPGEGIVADDQ